MHNAFQDYVLNDALFRVFDEDDSGTLNFFEWFQASNVKNMATIEEKLNWIFTAFDADGGGSIDSEEIVEIVKWMFRSVGFFESQSQPATLISRILTKVSTLLILFPGLRGLSRILTCWPLVSSMSGQSRTSSSFFATFSIKVFHFQGNYWSGWWRGYFKRRIHQKFHEQSIHCRGP